ncbi:hypothetical protein Caci_0371 [Catenulispora acidiphila DSM 44928]|uniref:Uncharacterized protein n=1 Tax=Catenulispora acidiphila (strain DSM 44928 / JCM 14897 / NBRC 102108 / NRRL B-24433 / ID139908) TaxID=479433 RepID=C7PVG8_CATAD|nr:hypothetical protein Caci_0371 [Catenulispora acidiphila DSM 44928]
MPCKTASAILLTPTMNAPILFDVNETAAHQPSAERHGANGGHDHTGVRILKPVRSCHACEKSSKLVG